MFMKITVRSTKIICGTILLILGGCTTAPNQLPPSSNPPTVVTPPVGEERLPSKPPVSQSTLLGIDNFLHNYLTLVQGKRVGLLTNPSGVNRQLQSTVDLLYAQRPAVQLTALFAPEHGIRGAVMAGEKVANEIDPKTRLPVHSLYGGTLKPTPAMLSTVDVLMVDIQDIGLRSYTYIYTMAKLMEAAAEQGKPVIVLDRPNPIGGIGVEGNLVEAGFFSFVGLYPIPYRHGMTIGELARLFNEEFGIRSQLTVIPLLNWQRSMTWKDTGLAWIPTSPHVPTWETIPVMGATGTLGELGTVSTGIGYTLPFGLIGAPWINGEQLANQLNRLQLPGVFFRPTHYKPFYGKYQNTHSEGVQLHLTDIHQFKPFVTGLHLMKTLVTLYPSQNLWGQGSRLAMFNKVMGTDKITHALQQGQTVAEIERSWQSSLQQFQMLRQKYLLYP